MFVQKIVVPLFVMYLCNKTWCWLVGGGIGFIGQQHKKLKNEDFALGFMNSTMENKLKAFGRIICMDGTHGTNINKYELTIMQIKDNKNAGFPVAFFLSNR